MYRISSLFLCLWLTTIFSDPVGAQNQISEKATELLSKVQNNSIFSIPISYDANVLFNYPYRAKSPKELLCLSSRYSGEKIDVVTQQTVYEDNEPFSRMDLRAIWDGSMFIQRQKSIGVNANVVAQFSRKDDYKNRIHTGDDTSSILDGFFFIDGI